MNQKEKMVKGLLSSRSGDRRFASDLGRGRGTEMVLSEPSYFNAEELTDRSSDDIIVNYPS